jgi:glycosyltransferase involved in cell wall biosynthesis
MRILEVNKYLYLRRGAEKHMLDLVELLQKNGHDVRLFGMEHSGNISQAKKEDLLSYVGYNKDDSSWYQRLIGGGRIFWSFEAARKMQKIITAWQPEIIHIHNIYHQLSLSILRVAKSECVPVIMTVHDYAAISPDKDTYYPEVGKQYWKFLRVPKYSFSKRLLLVLRAYWESLLGGYNAFVDVFIAPSRIVQDTLIEAGIPKEKIILLPHFISAVPKENIRQALTVALPEKFLLTLNGASIEKNTPLLEELSIRLGVPLVVCGSIEPQYPINESSLIVYLGQKNTQELESIWPLAIAGVSASHLPETFGLVALEAIAHGKPFFCFDSGAYGEIIRSGKDGIVAKTNEEFEKSLEELLAGSKQYNAFAIQREAFERFSDQKFLDTMTSIMLKLKNNSK